MPVMRLRVVWGLVETIATFSPTRTLSNVDFPTFGRPTSAMNPDLKSDISVTLFKVQGSKFKVSSTLNLEPCTLNVLLLSQVHFEMEFFELLVVHPRRRIGHQAGRPLSLGEGDGIADRRHTGEQHHQAIKSEGDTTMRR